MNKNIPQNALPKQQKIPISFQYIPETESVRIWVSAFSMTEVPMQIFEPMARKMVMAHAGNSKLVVPDKRIVVPTGS